MIEIKEVKEEGVLSTKEGHVLSCFTDYLYYKRASDLIQEEPAGIAAELSSGSTLTGIIRISKDKGSYTFWENELLTKEHELVQGQDRREGIMEVVRGRPAKIKNPDHENITVGYLINNRGENVEMVAGLCSTSPSNVYKAIKRLIKNFARRIP